MAGRLEKKGSNEEAPAEERAWIKVSSPKATLGVETLETVKPACGREVEES